MNDPRILKLFYDNKSDPAYAGRFGQIPGATLSGGSWVIPLANLQDPELGLIARTASADADDARFTIAFTSLAKLSAFFLCNTNLSVNARIRLVGYYDAARTELSFDLTFDAYPGIGFTEELEWEDENSWDGKPLSKDLEGLTQNAWTVFPDDVRASVLDVQILDESNPDGFIDLGRLLCMSGWQPARNPLLGSSLGIETDTTAEKSMSGAESFDRREPFRVYQLNYGYLPEQETLDRGLEMARRIGIDGEVFVVNDSRSVNLHRLSFLARLRQPPAWERSAPRMANIAFQLKERLP
ncbi:hypothetical protein [Aureimonas phyllosphaerae]|uniref:Uncharacterized protein n=1 Tax=Aureimonas phyllosphaerae TaxID=1166078 RepID=A0A7W6FVZ6_9HYPH|nr:hypothetical protein [Aureimonas phyllosphaerae]MBB3937668.1 hypothetical protein [Aureimonas phyllosphaerae]MBB3961796.1 hypothetical protein [Aureimonas phyllosphaerae]SFF44919.1 hypothetical protein SAMN05216566_1148 [Aureimonas phyllosphaerae]